MVEFAQEPKRHVFYVEHDDLGQVLILDAAPEREEWLLPEIPRQVLGRRPAVAVTISGDLNRTEARSALEAHVQEWRGENG